MKLLNFVFFIFCVFLISNKTFGSSIVSNEEKIWMIGCDGKVYVRSNDSQFKALATKLPNNVAAKDLMFRKVLISGLPGGVGSGAAKYDEALYIVGTDGNLYVNSPNDKGFELSSTQLPNGARCESNRTTATTTPAAKTTPAVR